MKRTLIVASALMLLLALSFVACDKGNKTETENEVAFVLPDGAIPIDYDGHIYIHGDIDGTPADVNFDTAGYWLWLDSLFNEKNPRSGGQYVNAVASGAGEGTVRIKMLMDSLQFNFSGRRRLFSKVPIIDIKEIVGDRSDGLIGAEYFFDKVLKIDYKHMYMQAFKHIDSIDLAGYRRLPLEITDDKIFFVATTYLRNGAKVEGRYLLDTGSGGTIRLSSHVGEKLGLDRLYPDRRVSYTSTAGISSGGSVGCDIIADSVSIAGFTLNDFEIDYSKDKSGAYAKSDRVGIVGNGLLDNFDVIIDFPHKMLYLKPNEDFNKVDDHVRVSDYGFFDTNRSETLGAWIVNGLYHDEGAEKAGLLPIDTIIAINGRVIANEPYEMRDSFFRDLKIGTPIELTIRKGTETKKISIESRRKDEVRKGEVRKGEVRKDEVRRSR